MKSRAVSTMVLAMPPAATIAAWEERQKKDDSEGLVTG